jgi:hypothetical protein
MPQLKQRHDTARPDRSDTSRSADGPPSITVTFQRSSLGLPHDLQLRLQLNPVRPPPVPEPARSAATHRPPSPRLVHNEISVHLRNHRPAHPRPLQPQFVHQLARRDRRRILEDTTRARGRRLRLPALRVVLLRPLSISLRDACARAANALNAIRVLKLIATADTPPPSPPPITPSTSPRSSITRTSPPPQISSNPSPRRSCATPHPRCPECPPEIPDPPTPPAAPPSPPL